MLSSLLSSGSVGEILDLLSSISHKCVCVCVWVCEIPTPLQHITPTSHWASLAVTHHAVKQGAATHKLCLEDTRRPGKPTVGLSQCFSVFGSRVLSGSFCWLFTGLYIWLRSSSQTELPRCQLGSLELWEAHRGIGKVATPQDLQLSPRGTGVLVSQWEWCHIAVQTRHLTDKTAAAPNDEWAVELSQLNLRWKCETFSEAH